MPVVRNEVTKYEKEEAEIENQEIVP